LEFDITYPDIDGGDCALKKIDDPGDRVPGKISGLWIPPEWLRTSIDQIELIVCVSTSKVELTTCSYGDTLSASVEWVQQNGSSDSTDWELCRIKRNREKPLINR
jgi:hypothetical protein